MTDTALATGPTEHLVDWRDDTVDVAGQQVHYRSAGDGDPLLVIGDGRSLADSPALGQLAAERRVIVAEPAGSPREVGSAIALLAAALDLGSAAVLGTGEGATAALWAAVDNPGLVTTLVLVAPAIFAEGSPADPQLIEAMPACEVPTLVLLGQRDPVASPRFAADYKRLPASSVALVYAAGADLASERPEAFVDTVRDYLRRGQAFVLSNRSTLIHP